MRSLTWEGYLGDFGGYGEESRFFVFDSLPHNRQNKILNLLTNKLSDQVVTKKLFELNKNKNWGVANEMMFFDKKKWWLCKDITEALQLLIDKNKKRDRYLVIHAPAWQRANDNDVHLFTTHKSLNFSYQLFFGRTTFESKDIPEKFIHELNQMDHVHCQSSFNLINFKRCGMKTPGFVLPNGISWDAFSKADLTRNTYLKVQVSNKYTLFDVSEVYIYDALARYDYKFLVVFNSYAEMWKRKNIHILLQEFQKFNDSVDRRACLTIKSNLERGYIKKNIHSNLDDVITLDTSLSMGAMRALYHPFDVFINLSSGEALGIPYLEAAACNNRIMALNYGGHLDFLNSKNSYLVKTKGFAPWVSEDEDVKSFAYDGCEFPTVDTDHLQKTFVEITGDISRGDTKDLKSIEMFNEACLIKWHVYISFLASKTTHQLKHKNIEKDFEIFAEKERYNFKGGNEINQEVYQNYYVK